MPKRYTQSDGTQPSRYFVAFAEAAGLKVAAENTFTPRNRAGRDEIWNIR